MDSSNLQSRASSSSSHIPPHRTQLHPRMHSFPPPFPPQPHPKSRPRFLVLAASLCIAPFLYYIFTTALSIHNSSKFADPNPRFRGLVIDAAPSGSRIRVFEFFNEGAFPSVAAVDGSGNESMKVRPGLAGFADDPEGAGRSISELIEFAKRRVRKKDRARTKAVLAVSGGLEGLSLGVRGRIVESCRRVLRKSGFMFRDEWAQVITGEDEGIFAWVAVNYILGSLGSESEDTTGTVELGGRSLEVTFAPRETTQIQTSRVVKLGGTTYNLYTLSLQQFGQDDAWRSYNELHSPRERRTASSSNDKHVMNPCLPKGYGVTSKVRDTKSLASYPAGNYSACKNDALALLRTRKDKCSHPPCKFLLSSVGNLQGSAIPLERFYYTSEFFGMFSREGLLDLRLAGDRYCGDDDWDKLSNKRNSMEDLDLSRYCFSSAYVVALLHDSLGIPFDEKRTGSIPVDWTLGAYAVLTMQDTVAYESDNFGEIVGNESVTYFSLFAVLLIVVLAAFLVSQWQKPQLKTIYDLEKGRYIVTRVPR
ncbi:probable apyrase 6 isoform X2 [Rhodamnia argentea]|uniref:apyrase n=1 Tax=Rhodamnia argentea TaxID=178133 RepID=A0ABM3HHI1_9MYRT|nr:probable apyrase 6 isoform X2 [Rhodamnia argentea]